MEKDVRLLRIKKVKFMIEEEEPVRLYEAPSIASHVIRSFAELFIFNIHNLGTFKNAAMITLQAYKLLSLQQIIRPQPVI